MSCSVLLADQKPKTTSCQWPKTQKCSKSWSQCWHWQKQWIDYQNIFLSIHFSSATRCGAFPHSNIYNWPSPELLVFSPHVSRPLPPALISISVSGRGATLTLAPSGAKSWLLLPTWSWCDPRASPERSSGIPARFIIPSFSRRLHLQPDWDDGWDRGALEESAIWCIAFVKTVQTNHKSFERSSLMNELSTAASCCLVLRQPKSYIC